MPERPDSEAAPLDVEFDQYQRYAFLRRIMRAAYPDQGAGREPIAVLDVGSGPERLTERFLGDGFAVVRCDVESFGQDDIRVIPADGPLPFPDEAFAAVVALEVLEHVDDEGRRRLIEECLRVARDLVVCSCPDNRPEVVAAERRVADAFERLMQQPHPFLAEHAEKGLPTEETLRSLFADAGAPALVVGNSPLDRWEAVLMLDQLLRTVERGPELARDLYRRANEAWPARPAREPYRRFYVAPKRAQVEAAVAAAFGADEEDDSPGRPDPVFRVAQLAATELAARASAQADVEGRLRELTGEREAFTSLAALVAADSGRRGGVARAARAVGSSAWTNHPYAASGSSVTNVRSGGHSLWCFAGPGTLSLRAGLPAGTYRIHARALSSVPADLEVHAGTTRATAPMPQRRAERVAVDFSLESAETDVALSLSPPAPAAVVADLQILRRAEEPRATTIRRNALAIARRRPGLLALAQTRVGRSLVRRFPPPPPPVPAGPSAYHLWIEQRLAERAPAQAPRSDLPTLSLLTTVWDTPVEYLETLARSVLSQTHSGFEWIVLDNGSTDPAVIDACAALGRDNRVRLERSDANLGIVGGLRRCLERATGRYVLPVDSDDYLYADALELVASALAAARLPALAYSDEDKLYGDQFVTPYLKPDWDPVLFLNSCYIAHLCAVDRVRALELGVYEDGAAEGCHDWDTFTRFMLAGEVPLHVDEVLYSWRMHPESAALNIGSKPYLDASHVHVLQKFLDSRPRPDLYRIERSPLWGPTPNWWFRRRRVEGRPMTTVRLGGSGEPAATLRPVAERAASDGALLQLVWEQVELQGDEGAWDALALFELHPDTVMVGGRVLDRGRRIVAAGDYFGFGGACGCPDLGRDERDSGYFGQMWKQRSVSAVSSMLALVDPGFLLEALDRLEPASVSLPFLGAWLGAIAALEQRRVVFTPFLVGRTKATREAWDALVSPAERTAFLERFADELVPETRYLSRWLSLDPASPYTPAQARPSTGAELVAGARR